ncbi:efflux RND transporter permease subunit [Marinobacterium sediminicola]|uniref:Multidrug efflux pump n=1 Tax=Marinobacterium sediminicola TaxID=518898 RepID=A0ABY1RVW5_9GAMM|nr:efflux RND transporter permease subunit [Marinobacterium sediminicola]ULG70520.1 efflux RND transporter permease subunit [Marinobacterium sediminicola]SMR69110.1 multidrug efflux pump [Marinobacterium sediminicola]
MILSDISIKRPVLASVLSLLILLVGLIAYDRLSVREYPKIDVPVVSVETVYPGASASIIESQVTKIIEDSLSGIEGIDFISSISRSEKSQISVTFRLERDPDDAASEVRDRVGRVRGQLPDDIEEPVVAKSEADAQPIIWIALSSDSHTTMEVTDYAENRVKDPLQTVPGVASVMIVGERRYAMRIWLDPQKMAAYRVVPQDIEAALSAQNVEIPAGRIESRDREFTVLAQTDLNSVSEFERIIIRNDNGYPVRVRDVARVEIAPASERNTARFNGNNAVALGVIKQSTANPLDVSAGVREMLVQIEQNLPPGMHAQVGYDSSIFIEESIESVFTTLWQAGVLVVLVIFFFLRNLKATLIPVITIPLSLVGAFAMMLLMDFSINTLTLLALVLAIGLVVDDAIVMLENIYRHVEAGLDPIQAAFKGAREIGFAVIATTATLVAVFVPVAFSTGRTGKLFTEFALTLAGAVVVSTFIALSLSPMLSSRLLHHEKRHSAIFNLIEGWLNRLSDFYQRILSRVLRSRLLAVFLLGASAAGAAYFYQQLPQELAPTEDRGTIMTFSISPEGSSVDYVDRYARQVEKIVGEVPEGMYYFGVVGFPSETNSLSFLRLENWDQRERKQQAITDSLTPQLYAGVTGNMSFAMNLPSLGQSIISRPVEFIIKTTADYEQLAVITDKMMEKIAQNPGLAQPDSDLKLNKPELLVTLNRDKVSDVGIDVNTIGRSLETFMAGRELTRYKQQGEQYDVILQIEDRYRQVPGDLTNAYVRGSNGDMIQLANLVTVEESITAKELNHFDKLKAVKIQAMLAPGYSLGEALTFMEQSLKEVAPEALYDYAGQSREFKESSNTLQMTFGLALIFIFLVLSAQFESFKNPLIIMLSVPPALAGALLALHYSGGSLSIYSQIGLITLVGLVTKHGILIIEFANQLQDRGTELRDAVVEAAALRLRPILMTTGATVLGALPLAVAFGAGAESRQQIGWVIVGGMLLGTLLTLFVIPTVYSYLGKRNFRQVEPDPAHR